MTLAFSTLLRSRLRAHLEFKSAQSEARIAAAAAEGRHEGRHEGRRQVVASLGARASPNCLKSEPPALGSKNNDAGDQSG